MNPLPVGFKGVFSFSSKISRLTSGGLVLLFARHANEHVAIAFPSDLLLAVFGACIGHPLCIGRRLMLAREVHIAGRC